MTVGPASGGSFSGYVDWWFSPSELVDASNPLSALIDLKVSLEIGRENDRGLVRVRALLGAMDRDNGGCPIELASLLKVLAVAAPMQVKSPEQQR